MTGQPWLGILTPVAPLRATQRKVTTMIRNFFAREELVRHVAGQTLVEYALIIALVSIALVVALGALAGGIGGVFTTIVSKL